MIPVLFRIGPISVYSYGVMIALGFIAGNFVLASEMQRKGYNPEQASTFILWYAISGLAGSRIYDIIAHWQFYAQVPLAMVLSGGGFVFYGGFLTAVAVSFFLARHYKIPWVTLADMTAPALAIGHAIGRLGCQFAGDGDWGMVSTVPWAMAYPRAIVGWNAQTVLKLDANNRLVPAFFPGVRVHPTPVYESLLYLTVFLILWRIRKWPSLEGRLFFVYLVLIGLSRFTVEFFRINPRVMMGLSEAQVIALGLMISGAVAYVLSGIGPLASPNRAVSAE